MDDTVRVEVIKGREGSCLAIDGTRVAGPKPWGGGTVTATFGIDRSILAYNAGIRLDELLTLADEMESQSKNGKNTAETLANYANRIRELCGNK